jgi:hypothetical protein
MPIRFGNMDTKCHMEGRAGRIEFIPRNMMGTAVSGSEEIFKVCYTRRFCRFGITGVCTMRSLTLIFRTLIPDWQIIPAGTGMIDVIDGIEIDVINQCLLLVFSKS